MFIFAPLHTRHHHHQYNFIMNINFPCLLAVINAVGGIASGQSGRGAQGASLGSETFVEDIRRARNDPR